MYYSMADLDLKLRGQGTACLAGFSSFCDLLFTHKHRGPGAPDPSLRSVTVIIMVYTESSVENVVLIDLLCFTVTLGKRKLSKR